MIPSSKQLLADGFLFEPKRVGTSPLDDADWPAAGFADFAGGDYRLTAASKYHTLGTDGRPLGADIDAIEAAVKKGWQGEAAAALNGRREENSPCANQDAVAVQAHAAGGDARAAD